MQKPKSPVTRLTEYFDIPTDAVTGVTHLTITGNRRLHVYRHNGVLEYSRELISVNCGKKILEVHGVQLDLVSMSSAELLIIGDICRIEFS